MSDKITLFGQNHNQIGSSSAGLILKTSGSVKIQWGSKFIDLIKDGKINADVKFIYKQDEVGSKDGIYVSTDGSQINLVIGGEVINLVGDSTYVSFLEGQKTSSEQKYHALTNIGFMYKTLSDIDDTSLQNGIIYIESEQKLYTVVNGVLTEYTMTIPNPYTKQFVLAKTSSETGAIVIQGEGIENSLAFNNMYLYSDGEQSIISVLNELHISISNEEIFTSDGNTAEFGVPVITDKIQSNGATSDLGFRLYIYNGESTLEVDNLIVRNSSSTNSVDIDFTTDVVDFNIEDYLSQTDILALINDQEDNTNNTYKGYHGQITVMKENGISTVSGMIRGKLKDGTYSYRTINGIYNGDSWEETSSYIIQNQFNPGYYWSSEQIDNIPVYPSYVGTTYEGFEVTSYKKYLWYTNDGDTWSLVREYIDPDPDRIYIATSIKGIYSTSTGEVNWPAGFICYYNGAIQTPLGKSNFTSAPNNTVIPDLSKISSLAADAVAGYIPSNTSYPFIWSIKSEDDKSILSNWTLEKSYSLLNSFNNDLLLDWGNLSVLTSNRWVKYDTTTNQITEVLYPTTNETAEYWATVYGTLTNWQDETWRHYFLQTAIGMVLGANTQAYDETFGFNFSYTNLFEFKCFGFAGYIVGRSGAIKDPTSDDPSDIGYIPTPVFDFISGHLTAYGYTIDFYLEGLEIGKRLEGVGQAPFNNSSIGAQVNTTNFYEIGSYKLWTINVTDMSTGTLTVING